MPRCCARLGHTSLGIHAPDSRHERCSRSGVVESWSPRVGWRYFCYQHARRWTQLYDDHDRIVERILRIPPRRVI